MPNYLLSVVFTLACLWPVSSSLLSLSFTSNVTSFKYAEPFLLECTINGFFPADRFYQIMFMHLSGSIATYQYKRPEKNLQPQMLFAETETKGVNVSSTLAKSPQFQIEVTAASQAIPADDTFWCEYSEESGSVAKSNVWKSRATFNSSPNLLLLVAAALLAIFYFVH